MNTKFTQIIAAYVPSKSSRIALRHARDIAQRHKANLTILNVNPHKSEEGQVKKEIEEIMDSSNVHFIILEKKGKPYKEILALEKELEADLIVMGTHGNKERDPDWIGGNAFKVLSGSSCPVLTFTPNNNSDSFSGIVLPIADASETRQKVPLTVALAKAYDATVHIAIVNKDDNPSVINTLKVYASQAEGYCIDNGVDFTYKEIYNKNIADACVEYAKEVKADLISIMSERESPTGFFMGHYAQQLVNKSDISVLTIHIKSTMLAGGGGY